MNAILNLLIKSLIAPFYRSHAGLLLLVFFLMFGVVESTQIKLYHESLIYGMLTSGIFLMVVLIVWLLYSLKSLHFLLKASAEDSYQFLHHLAVLPARQTFFYFFIICFLTFMPVFTYTVFIYAIGFKDKFYEVIAIVFVFQLALWLFNAWTLNYTLRNQHRPSWFTIPSLALPFQQNLVGIYAGYLFKEEKSAMFLSKLFSIVVIYLVKETLEAGDDFRIVGIMWLFALISHTYLINKLKVFEDHTLSWMRHLPISITKTISAYFILYILLMIPEVVLLTGTIGRGLSWWQLALLPLFSGGFFLAIHSYLFKANRNPDKFATYLFWLFMGCFMMILSKLIWVAAAALLIGSFWLLRIRFYRYEAVETES
jgi:hypothetical protein